MQEQMFNKHLGSTGPRSSKGPSTAHRSFKNTKQFIEAVADLPEEEDDEVKIERKSSRGSLNPVIRDEESEVDDDDDDVDDAAPFLESVTEQQVCSAFELAVRCVCCPINHNYEMLSTYMANDFEYLKKALGLRRKDLRTELRSAKRKSRLIVEELQQRLNNLDNHFFYKKSAFQTERHFENWRQREKSDLERLINQLKQVPAFSATLNVKILGGKELITKDGASQPTKPFCTLILGKITRQTQIVEKTASPTWNEVYNLTVLSLSDMLHIEVFDKTLLGSSSLGYVNVPLSELEDQLAVDKWYPLQAKAGEKKKATGSLRLVLHLTYREGPLLEKPDDSASPFYPTNYQNTNYNLLYQVLLYSLCDWDKNPASAKVAARGKGGSNNAADDDDDDIPEVVKWEDVVEVKSVESGPEARKKRAEMMRKEGMSGLTSWLLREYAQRYGVGEIFALLAYLEMLISQFRLSTARMDLIHEVLIELKVLTSTTNTIAIPEAQMDEALTQSLKRKIGTLLKDYHAVFAPDKVGPGALGTAIVILSFLSTHDSEKLCNMLEQYVKRAVEKTYKTFKQQATGETPEKQLVVACGFIPAAIEHDKILFLEEFPKEMNLSQVLGEHYYSLISKDVRAYYSGKTKVSPNTFDLYDRLRDLQEVLGIEREHALPLKAIFQKYIDQWLVNFAKKVKKWNEESISSDAWVPFVPLAEQDGEDQLNGDDDVSRALHSSSVVELFVSLTECRKFMNRIKSLQSPAQSVAFANAVSAVVKDYAARVQNECFDEIHSDAGQFSETVDFTVYVDLKKKLKKKLKDSEKVALIVRKELCVRINNLEHITDNIPYFCQKVDDTLGEEVLGGKSFTTMMADTGAWLENTRQEIIDAIITKMNTFLQFALEISAQPSLKNKKERKSYDDDEEMTEVEKRSEALIAYLSTQLIVLSDNLYFPVFVRLLDGVWTLLLKDIELMIVPPINDVLEKTFVPNEEYRKLIPQFLDELKQFIHAEGAGLPMEAIDAKCEGLLRTLSLFEESSRNLMFLFKDLVKRATESLQLPEEVGHLEETVLSILAQRKGDKEARKFAKANKAMAQNIMLRKKFGLDNDEALVEKFRCSNAKMNGGWLYITSSFICFDTLLQQDDSRLAVKIEDVREVKKYKFAQVVDNGIKFAMKTGKKYHFSGFQKRNQALSCILNQAKQLDCILGQKERDRSRTVSTDGMGARSTSFSGMEESDTSDWSDTDSEESSQGSTSHRTTDASGRKKKGIKSKIARKLGKGRHSRSQSLSVDPSEAHAVALEGRSSLSVSAKNIQAHPRSAANSPLLRRAFKNSNGKRASMGDTASAVSESDNDFDDDDDDDFTATDTDTATDVDSDESDDSDDDQGPVRSQSAIAGHARTSSFLSAPPAAAAPGSASPFSKGHRRGQSVDHAALKKLVPQESAGMAIPSGSVDELKVAQGRRAEGAGAGAGAEEKAGSAKGEKKKAKHGAKQEAREAKAQKRKQEQAQKKTTKLAKRFALTESSKYLSEMKCTYVSGNLFKGKLYIISNCLCFYSSALAGVTKIVVPWGAVTTIVKRQEKRGDAVEVNTNDNNFVFSGFDDRDAALAEITQRWQAHKKRS